MRPLFVPLNRPFSSCPLPHFHNESSCEWFHTKTRFDSEAKGNSEMAYFSLSKDKTHLGFDVKTMTLTAWQFHRNPCRVGLVDISERKFNNAESDTLLWDLDSATVYHSGLITEMS